MLKLFNPLKSFKGMAFFITLAVLVSFLCVVATFHGRSHFMFKSFIVNKGPTALRHVAASGINLGMAVLVLDKSASTEDSLLNAWADQDALWNMSQRLTFQDGLCLINISDLSGRIPVNALAEHHPGDNHEALARVLETLIAENLTDLIVDGSMTPRRIVTNIRQYIENNPYAEYNYFNDPRELLQVDGITPLLLFGERGLDRDFNSDDHWKTPPFVVYDESFGRKAGLAQFITVFGMSDNPQVMDFPGQININTAPREVLYALFANENVPLFDTIYRKMQATLSGSANESIDFHNEAWFKEEVTALGYPEYRYDEKLITTQSDWFEICAVSVTHNGMEKRIKAVVHREFTPSNRLVCKIYSWEESDTAPVAQGLSELLRQSNLNRPQRPVPFSEIRSN